MDEFDDSDVEEIQLFQNVNNPSPARRSPSDNSTSSVLQSKHHGRANCETYPQATKVPHIQNTGSTMERSTKGVVMQQSRCNLPDQNDLTSSPEAGESITSLKRLHENETNSEKTLKRQKTIEEESDSSKETKRNIHDEKTIPQIKCAIKQESENNGIITDSHWEPGQVIGSGTFQNDSNALQNHEKSSLNMECPPIAIVSPLPDQSASNPNSPEDDLDKLDAKILSDEDFDQSLMDDFPCSLDEMVNSIFTDKQDTFQTLDGSSWSFPDLQNVSIEETQHTVNDGNESVDVVKPSDQSISPKETEKAPDVLESSNTKETYESTDQSNKSNPPVMYQTDIASIKKEQIPEHENILNNDSGSKSVPVPNHQAKSSECSLKKKELQSQIDLAKTDKPPVKSELLLQIPCSSQGEPFSDFLQRYSPSYMVPTERITPPRSDITLRKSGYNGHFQTEPPNQIIPDLEQQIEIRRRYGNSTSVYPFPAIESVSENENFIMNQVSHDERPRGPPVLPNYPTANVQSGMHRERLPGPPVFPNQPTANGHFGMQQKPPLGSQVFSNQQTANIRYSMQSERLRGPSVYPNQPTANIHPGMQQKPPRGPPVYPNQPTANIHSGMQNERLRGHPVFPNQPTGHVQSGMQQKPPRGPPVYPNQPTANIHSSMQRFRPPHSSSMLPRQPSFNQQTPMNQPGRPSHPIGLNSNVPIGLNSNVHYPRTMFAPNSNSRLPFGSNLPQHSQNSHNQLMSSMSSTANVQWGASGQFNRSNQVLKSPPVSMFQANHDASYNPLINAQVPPHSLNRFHQALPPVNVPPQKYAQGQIPLPSHSQGHHFTTHQQTMCSKNQPNSVGIQGRFPNRLPSSSSTAGQGDCRSQQEPFVQQQFSNQFHNNPSIQVAYRGQRLSSSCDQELQRHGGINTSPKQSNDSLFSYKMSNESPDSSFIDPLMVTTKEALVDVIRQSKHSKCPTVKHMVGTFLQRVKHVKQSVLSDAERGSFVEETKKFIYDVTVLIKAERSKQPQSPNTNSNQDRLIPIPSFEKGNTVTEGDKIPCSNTYDNYNMQHTQTFSGNQAGMSIPQNLTCVGSSGNWTGLANYNPMSQYQSPNATSLHISNPFMDDIQKREAGGTRGVGAQFGNPPQLWNMDGTAATTGSSVKQGDQSIGTVYKLILFKLQTHLQ